MSQTLHKLRGNAKNQIIQVEAKTIRAYYNAGNDNEPFCVDFGPGSLSIVCPHLYLRGEGSFRFDPKGDPKVWVEYTDHTLRFDIKSGFVSISPI